MLSGGLDGLYRSFLAGPHKPTCRVEVWAEGARIDSYGDIGVPLVSGTVQATLASRVARTAQLGISPDLFPDGPGDLLYPDGNYLKIYRGVDGFGGPSYEWQVFYGRINNVRLNSGGDFTLNAIDLAGDVAGALFATPRQSNVNQFITTQFTELIKEAIPGATFGTFDTTYARTPNLVWQLDRSAACDQLANAANMYWYPLANGNFVMRTIAWDTASPSLLTLTDGDGGTLSAWSYGFSRAEVANNVYVVGERSDGSTPVYGSASDGDPTSPTYIGGKFGVQSQQISVQTVTSSSQAQQIARSYLHQLRALTQVWTVSAIADPALELGDALTIVGHEPSGKTRTSSIQVVSDFTLPLTGVDGNMTINFRAQQPGGIG
jgi:Domain of unknown function (DUF5047)